jgi:transcription elongation factor Elf1
LPDAVRRLREQVIVSVLKIFCPHCNHASEDSFEVLDPDTIDAMRCEHCEKQFWFAIMECHACGHEQVFTWMHQASAAALSMLTCEACGTTFRRDDAAIQTSLE